MPDHGEFIEPTARLQTRRRRTEFEIDLQQPTTDQSLLNIFNVPGGGQPPLLFSPMTNSSMGRVTAICVLWRISGDENYH